MNDRTSECVWRRATVPDLRVANPRLGHNAAAISRAKPAQPPARRPNIRTHLFIWLQSLQPRRRLLGERYNVLPTQAGFDPGKLLLSLSTPPAPLIGTKTCQPNAQTLLVPPSTAFHTLIVLTQDPLCWPERCCASCRLSTFSGEQQLRLAEYAEILPHSTSPGAQEL